MLFDNNNVDLDFAFLNLAGFNNDNMSKNMNMSMNNPNVLSAKEGFLRGNMFKNEYLPYRNLTFINISPKSDREAKLFNVMAYSFAINDLNLYLDLHPEDKSMLDMLENFIREEKIAKEEYNRNYGPLDICEVKGDKFDWIDSPWPWQNTGGDMYV